MERRQFLKISAVSGATAALDGCGQPERQLIRFIPEEELVPGVATWKPSICTLCPAGCGLMVRVMEGEAEVMRNGKLGLIKMGLAKKLEGNPHHPINQGKLCPRGQAGLQVTYHPDRLRSPLKRAGPRGSGQFEEIGWDQAVQELVSRLHALRIKKEASTLAVVTRPLRGHRRLLLEQFLAGFGAPPPVTFEFFDNTVLRWANLQSFGRAQMPTYDLARANYVISFGADFLGTWNSPVAQSLAYGEMRQGRPGVRGKFVQVEPRMSQTGANADEWLPARPGTEGVLALGFAHVILREKLRQTLRSSPATSIIAGWFEGLPDYSPEEVQKQTGVPAAKVTRLARELASQAPALAIVAGAPLAHTNGLFTALSVNALNELLDNVEKPGGIFFTPQFQGAGTEAHKAETVSTASHSALRELAKQVLLFRPLAPKVVLLYEANPVFASPPEWRVGEAFEKVPFIASFDSFLNESSAMADLILPDHSPLESWLDQAPESGTTLSVASVAAPAVRPLYNTRAMPDVLIDVARRLGSDVSPALPWKSYEEMLRSSFEQKKERSAQGAPASSADSWKKVLEQGGWWGPKEENGGERIAPLSRPPLRLAEPEFDVPAKDFPFHLLPFASQTVLDGSLAHLPWMQELPEVLSTAMWGSWVEINPKTAERLSIRQGDLVEVRSQHGAVRAPALLSPGIAPDVIAMPVGQGHENFTRYASTRGANPIALLAPLTEPETGSLAWAATRVGVLRVGRGKLNLFAGGLSRFPHEREQR